MLTEMKYLPAILEHCGAGPSVGEKTAFFFIILQQQVSVKTVLQTFTIISVELIEGSNPNTDS